MTYGRNKPTLLIVLFLATITEDVLSQIRLIYPYPSAKKEIVVDTIHGKAIQDEYRYLEDSKNPLTIQWIEEQKKLTNGFHKKSGLSNLIYKDLFLLGFSKTIKEDTDKDERNDDQYFFAQRNNNLDAEGDVYYKKGENGSYRRLAKTRKFRYDKNDVIDFTHIVVNNEETHIAFMVDHSGTERHEIYVYDLKTEKLLSDKVDKVRYGSLIWNGDGFYYTKYDQASENALLTTMVNQRICYHKLGEDPENDMVVFYNQDASGTNQVGFYELDKNNWILSYPLNSRGTWYRAYATVIANEDYTILPKNFLVTSLDETTTYSIEAVLGDNLIIKTNRDASNFKLLAANKNELNKLYSFAPETDKVLMSVNQLGSNLISAKYFSKGIYEVLIFDETGKIVKNFNFPEGTRVRGFRAKQGDNSAYYFINSFYFPSAIYRLNLSTLESKPYGKKKIPFSFKDYKTEYVTYKSKDGTDVNMYLTYNKDIKFDGANPTLIYGYGGYGSMVTPYYSSQNIIWLTNGGILAIPNVRGGGAQGSDWSKAGRKHKKQNAIDDFISAAEYLVENQYTNPKKIAIEGGSHGGMLVAAAMLQRPDLYRSVISNAAVLDLTRFQNYTIGVAASNINEFGDINDSTDFQYMYKYSPYHNISMGAKYPNLLLRTGDKDTRVPPFHSYKFLAKMQGTANGSSNYIMKITESSGHTGPETRDDVLTYQSIKYAFLFETMWLKYHKLPLKD